MLYTIISMGTIFITSSLNAMEIVQKSKNKTTYTQKHTCNYPIAKELLFVHAMRNTSTLPDDVIKCILQYSIALKNKDLFTNTSPFMTQWHLYRIPLVYHHLLTPKQKQLIQKLFASERISRPNKCEYREYCILNSDKDYQLFLTLPIGLRIRLTQLPSSTTTTKYTISADTILIKRRSYSMSDVFYDGYTKKPIIPEEKNSLSNNSPPSSIRRGMFHSTD